MIFQTFPPVGRPLRPAQSANPLLVNNYSAIWLSSGTAALALAISLAKAVAADTDNPQVILPAYGCPDLVAAAVYAGVEPVLVDINESDPSYNLDELSKAINSRVVAVVAVNFLGIRERLTELVATVRGQLSKALIIEDNAQWFPELNGAPGGLVSDISLTSFGRGKPVNIMGGGVLWVKQAYQQSLQQLLVDLGQQPKIVEPGAGFKGRARIFNTLLLPAVFFWLSRIPALKVGATEYHPLQSIEYMDGERLGQVKASVAAYLAEDRWREKSMREALVGCDCLDLPSYLSHRTGRLLRYPILLPDTFCEERKHALLMSNLGISPFYKRPLIEIPLVADLVRSSSHFPGATKFARRLLTLPVHSGVNTNHVNAIRVQLSKSL